MGVDDPALLQLIGDDAADKVGCCIAEGSHEVVERGLVVLAHRDEAGALLASWTLSLGEVVAPQGDDERIGGLFEQFNDRVVQWVFVLVQPPNDSVANLKVRYSV